MVGTGGKFVNDTSINYGFYVKTDCSIVLAISIFVSVTHTKMLVFQTKRNLKTNAL